MNVRLAQNAIPGPRAVRPLGYISAFRNDPTDFLRTMAARYGDVVRFRLGLDYLYLVSHPDDIRDILVTHQRDFIKSRGLQFPRSILGNGLLTNEGESHLRQRRLVQPAFHRQRMGGYAATMSEYAARQRARWQDGTTIDVNEEMMRLTLAIVGKTLFGADVEGEATDISRALTAALGMFERITSPIGPLLERLPLPSNRRFNEALQRLDATVYRMIDERRATGEDRGDLLSMLLLAQEEDGDTTSGMTDRQVRDEAMTLFLAGHETTANALTWTWYLLAQNPEAEARLHAEVDAVLGDRLPGYENPHMLPYTRRVITESMRLYPPAWVIGRQPLKDYPIRQYTIPAGTAILMSQWVVHHDPRYYPDPDRFDPDRWLADEASRPKYAYFPFGGGARICIGESFAWTEAMLVLAVLARRWRLRLAPHQTVALRPLITLRPRNGILMTLEERHYP